MAGNRSESKDLGSTEALQADAFWGSFSELLGQVCEERPTRAAGPSSDEAPFSHSSLYPEPEQAGPQGLPVQADSEQLAQHAQHEAARLQLTIERRKRNNVAQAAYRRRKRVGSLCYSAAWTLVFTSCVLTSYQVQEKAASEKQELQRAATRIDNLEQQVKELRSGKVEIWLLLPSADSQVKVCCIGAPD